MVSTDRIIREIFEKSIAEASRDKVSLSKKLCENIKNEKDFSLHMAFSPLRESQYNWYDFKKKGSILQVGADYGEITGLFLGKGMEVTALTEEEKKDIIERRYEGERLRVIGTSYGNVIEEIKKLSGEKFDYITVDDIGLAHTELTEVIDMLTKLLSDDGRILLTIQNRYGLKYFLGAGDPYTGLPFDGVNGYLKQDTVFRCLSHIELDKIITASGIKKSKYYYPIPDSRMPQLIFTDEYQKGINAAERLVDYNYEDILMIGTEHRMFLEMINDGALGFMANSFIVELTNDSELSDISYAVTTTDRGEELGAATTIRKSGVVKRPLHKNGEKNIEKLHEYTMLLKEAGVNILENELKADESGKYLQMPFVNCEGLSLTLKQMAEDDKEGFIKIFDEIFEAIKKAKDKTGLTFIDLAPCNAFYVKEEGKVLFYDQEFVLQDVSIEFAMYRTIKYFYDSQRTVEGFVPKQEMNERYGISEEKIIMFEEREKEFIKSVRNTDDFNMMFKFATPDYDKIYNRMKTVARRIAESDLEEQKPYKIGYVPGVYDLFHTGHLRLFERCKARCEYLIVGVLTDELVEYYKGHKTVISYENRARVIEALKCVDEVIPVDFSNTDKLDAWNQLHYDCHFSGDDHVNHWNDVWEELKKRGSNMEFFSYTEGISSTQIRQSMNK